MYADMPMLPLPLECDSHTPSEVEEHGSQFYKLAATELILPTSLIVVSKPKICYI